MDSETGSTHAPETMAEDRLAQVIVLGNEKGGTGKSTTAMHLIVGLMRDGHQVASIDVDSHQGTLSSYVRNRQQFAESRGVRLPVPDHHRFALSTLDDKTMADQDERTRFDALLQQLVGVNDFIVIDCPGSNSFLARHALSKADCLITPINDSFIDLDLLATIGGSPATVQGPSVYSQIVWEQRQARARLGQPPIDWIVVRNRLSPLESHNKRNVAAILAQLAARIGFRAIDGFYERVVFRQLFLQGLTVLDLRDEGTDVELNMSHIAARREIRRLIDAIKHEDPALAPKESLDARPLQGYAD